MKKIKETTQLIILTLIIALGVTACIRINELPPAIESSNNVSIKLPNPPTLTDQEAEIVNQIKREYDENTK